MKKIFYYDKKDIILSIVLISSLLFTFFSLLFNSFYSLILWPLLPNIGANLLIFLVSFVFATAIFLISNKVDRPIIIERINFIYLSTVLYSSIFIIFNISTLLFKDVWNLYTIFIILALSLILSMIKKYVKINNYLLKSLIYYLIISIPYFIITFLFAGYSKGNQIIIVFSIYTIIYVIINIIIFSIIRTKNKLDNEQKQYSKQFK